MVTISSASLVLAVNNVNKGLEKGDKDMILDAVRILERGRVVDKDLTKQGLLRAYTGLCLVDSDNAMGYLEKARDVDPLDPAVHNNFGYILHKRYGSFDKAVASYEECIRLCPEFETAYLGIVDIFDALRLQNLKKEYILHGLRHLPQSVEIHNLYGLYLAHHSTEGNFATLAKETFQKALSFPSPSGAAAFSKVFLNMGHISSVTGDPSKAIECYVNAIGQNPTCPLAYSNILLNLHYITSPLDPAVLSVLKMLDVHRKETVGKGMSHVISLISSAFTHRLYGAPVCDSDAPVVARGDIIRVGFIGADFHGHAVACFMDGVLLGLSKRAGFEVFVYSNSVYDTATTASIPCHTYRCIKDMNGDLAARCIRQDKISLLIDLSGHTSGNRLDVVARRPAPHVWTYCGYPNDIGFPFVRRVSDTFTEKFNDWRFVDLGRLFLLYTPHPVYTGLPFKDYSTYNPNGIVTLGCFAKLPKINSRVIDLWCRVLERYGRTRLVLKSKYFKDELVKVAWIKRFGKLGKRVQLLHGTEGSDEHMRLFNVLDLHLDTFPYSGTTITTESLFMNVPVLTLCERGTSHVTRVSGSIIQAIGLEKELIATSAEDYIVKVGKLIPRLGELNVREKLLRSPFMDRDGMTEAFVEAIVKHTS